MKLWTVDRQKREKPAICGGEVFARGVDARKTGSL